MRIIGCDLHARQQTLAMLDTATGEVVEWTLKHESATTCESFIARFYRPVRAGIEATGSMQWLLNLMEELGIRMPSRSSSTDSGRRATEAENDSARMQS